MRRRRQPPNPVAGSRAVGHREHAGMNLFLYSEQIDQRLVYPCMREMAAAVEQSAERVFHAAGHCRVNVAFKRWQMNDIFAEKEFRYMYPARKNFVEHTHRGSRFVADPFYVRRTEVVFDRHVVAFQHAGIPVEPFPFLRVRNHGPVAYTYQIVVPGVAQRADHPFELPWSCVGAGEH